MVDRSNEQAGESVAVVDPLKFRIATARLCLVVPALDGAERVAEYCRRNRDHLARWESPHPEAYYSAQHWSKRIPVLHDEASAGSSLRLLLLDRENPDGPIWGTCSLTQFVGVPCQSCMLGFGLDKDQVGRGLMFEALTAVMSHAFEVRRVKRITANYMPSNERSAALLRKLGFAVEGYARDYVFIHSAWADHVLTSALNPDPSFVGPTLDDPPKG
jgi:ribosomal-protein-alanine N-acetyltransferase